MGVISPARPDLAPHREATSLPFPKLVQELVAVIGKKLTAYIAGVKDVRALDRWLEGAAAYHSAEERLRFAFRVIKTMQNQRWRDPARASQEKRRLSFCRSKPRKWVLTALFSIELRPPQTDHDPSP